MLITHIVLGYPSIEDNTKVVNIMYQSGIRKIELQIPFSDPLADGSVIHNANVKSLHQGMTVKKALEVSKNLKAQYPDIDFYIMTYGNIAFQMGIEQFIETCASIEMSGIIIPDIPLDTEEGQRLQTACDASKISNILVLSANADRDRFADHLKNPRDFLYLTSFQGTTGSHQDTLHHIAETVSHIRTLTNIPIAIGFGISTPEQVQYILTFSEYAIIGSHFLKVYDEGGEEELKKEILAIVDLNINS